MIILKRKAHTLPLAMPLATVLLITNVSAEEVQSESLNAKIAEAVQNGVVEIDQTNVAAARQAIDGIKAQIASVVETNSEYVDEQMRIRQEYTQAYVLLKKNYLTLKIQELKPPLTNSTSYIN